MKANYKPASSSDHDLYRAEVEFVSAAEWEQELSLMFEALSPAASGATQSDTREPLRLPEPGSRAHEALSKVKAAYGAGVDLAVGFEGMVAMEGSVRSKLGQMEVLCARTARELRDQYAVYADRCGATRTWLCALGIRCDASRARTCPMPCEMSCWCSY
eukprot:1261278-Rhodomonas_salina.4